MRQRRGRHWHLCAVVTDLAAVWGGVWRWGVAYGGVGWCIVVWGGVWWCMVMFEGVVWYMELWCGVCRCTVVWIGVPWCAKIYVGALRYVALWGDVWGYQWRAMMWSGMQIELKWGVLCYSVRRCIKIARSGVRWYVFECCFVRWCTLLYCAWERCYARAINVLWCFAAVWCKAR